MKRQKLTRCLVLTLGCSVALASDPGEEAVAIRAMKAADKDRDGRLTMAEFLPLDVQAKHHGDEHFEKGDANHDGVLELSELPVALHKQTWFAILSEGAEACFARIDADEDGKLTVPEYRKVSRMGGHAEQHFNKADLNHDGFLDLAELGQHAEAKLIKAGESRR